MKNLMMKLSFKYQECGGKSEKRMPNTIGILVSFQANRYNFTETHHNKIMNREDRRLNILYVDLMRMIKYLVSGK